MGRSEKKVKKLNDRCLNWESELYLWFFIQGKIGEEQKKTKWNG